MLCFVGNNRDNHNNLVDNNQTMFFQYHPTLYTESPYILKWKCKKCLTAHCYSYWAGLTECIVLSHTWRNTPVYRFGDFAYKTSITYLFPILSVTSKYAWGQLVSIIHYGYDVIKCDHKEEVKQDNKPQAGCSYLGMRLNIELSNCVCIR